MGELGHVVVKEPELVPGEQVGRWLWKVEE